MSTALKLRRGTTAQHSTFTGASGEITVDTDKKTLVVHDGVTAGGVPLVPATDVSTNGGASKILRTDASGNLGLGVTPSAWSLVQPAIQFGTAGAFISGQGINPWLGVGSNGHFNGTNWIYKVSNTSGAYFINGAIHEWRIAAVGTAGNPITYTQAMTLDASGNLGVGTTSPAQRLDVYGTGMKVNNASYVGYLGSGSTFAGSGTASDFTVRSDNVLSFATGGPYERARIDTSGNLLLMTTSTSITADVGIKFINGSSGNSYMGIVNSQTTNASANYHLYSTGAGAYRFYVGMGGTVYATSTTISSLSDQRHKENIRDLNVGLSEIMALKPRLYDWKEGKGADIKNARGFIAQEFEEVFPDLIDEWKDPAPEGEEPYKSVRADLIPVLVKAIQEQQAIITQLQADVAALKG